MCNRSQKMVACEKATKLSTLVSHQGSIWEAEPSGFVIWILFMQPWDLVKQSMEGCCICVWYWSLRLAGQAVGRKDRYEVEGAKMNLNPWGLARIHGDGLEPMWVSFCLQAPSMIGTTSKGSTLTFIRNVSMCLARSQRKWKRSSRKGCTGPFIDSWQLGSQQINDTHELQQPLAPCPHLSNAASLPSFQAHTECLCGPC